MDPLSSTLLYPTLSSILSRKIFQSLSSRHHHPLQGLNLEIVDSPEEADFLLAHGTEAMGTAVGLSRVTSMEEMKDILRQCSELPSPPPLIVANPDMVTVEARALRSMPGQRVRRDSSCARV